MLSSELAYGPKAAWGHNYVPAQFEGQLVNRQHRCSSSLRGTLERNLALRVRADYDEDVVSRTEAERALRRTRQFVSAIQEGGADETKK